MQNKIELCAAAHWSTIQHLGATIIITLTVIIITSYPHPTPFLNDAKVNIFPETNQYANASMTRLVNHQHSLHHQDHQQ